MLTNHPHQLKKREQQPDHSYQEFDCSRLTVLPICERESDLSIKDILPLSYQGKPSAVFGTIAERVVNAKKKGASVIVMMGAHVLRAGVQRFLIDMMEAGFISCIAINGAGVIHDYEFSQIGATTESVQQYIKDGRFGLWQETGTINEIVSAGARQGMGLGESVGKSIEEGEALFKNISILAAGYRLGIPVTVHVGIGYDIVHQFPGCDGGAYGESSYRDFLRFTHVMESLENGVVMNFGSAVMAPEVYLKSLSMVRNAARSDGRVIRHFSTLVCDLVDLPDNFQTIPDKTEPGYYFRPWKTMLVRTVQDGGQSFYVKGDHRRTIPQLWGALVATGEKDV